MSEPNRREFATLDEVQDGARVPAENLAGLLGIEELLQLQSRASFRSTPPRVSPLETQRCQQPAACRE